MSVFDDPDNPREQRAFGVFRLHAVEVPGSRAEGVPRFEDVPYCKIRFKDDPFAVLDEAATDEHKRRFPRQWEAFEKTRQTSTDGMPIEMFPLLTPADIAGLKVREILTVQALGKTDHPLADRAQQYLQGEPETIKALRARIKALEGEVAGLQSLVEQLKPKAEAA